MKYIGNYPEQEIVHTWADRYDYVFASDPTITVNPSVPYATWLNSSTGEVFVCTDNTIGSNLWIGELGTTIALGTAPYNISELEALWRAEDLVLNDGDNVTSWTDYTTNHTATDTEATIVPPKYVEDFANLSPAVYFEGYDTVLAKGIGLTLGSDYIYADSSKLGMTLFGVYQPADILIGNEGNIINFGAGANAFYAIKSRMNTINCGCSEDFGGNYMFYILDNIVSTPQLLIYVIEFGVSARTYIGSTIVDTATITLAQLTAAEINENATRQSSSGPVSIGVQSKNNSTDKARSFIGAIFETGIFTKALTQPEIDDLYKYYQTKYKMV